MTHDTFIIRPADPILVTGAAGFIGPRLVRVLLDLGFHNVRCFVRPSSDTSRIDTITRNRQDAARVDIIKGNLLSRADCVAATRDVAVVFHLAAGRGEKSFPDAFMNSVVATRNLLDATLQHQSLKRFVSISSFTVYSNRDKPNRRLLEESCP